MVGIQLKICKHCFRVMIEEELKYHRMLHEDKQYLTANKKYRKKLKSKKNIENPTLKKKIEKLECELCKIKNKEDSIKCKCRVEKFRKGIFELEKQLYLMNMKIMKENLEFDTKMYLGRYMRNRMNDSYLYFLRTESEEEALNVYDKYGEGVFENLLL